MAYTKNTWVDQDVERPKTYEVTNNQDGSITLTDSFGLVQELGTPVNAVNMNHIEDGIDGCAIRKHNLTETFNLGEWVLGGTGDDEGIYKSLVANNVGNAVTDDTKWEKVKMGGGSGLEICDIGMALYVDETKGLRRYLNGQIVDINTNTQAFLDRLKQITALHPSLLCTEEKWQTAKTRSAFGQVGKFVFNYSGDKIVSVRLPRVVNVQGLFDLQNLGMTVEAGLPQHTHTRGSMNITGGNLFYEKEFTDFWGAIYNSGPGVGSRGGIDSDNPVGKFDASRSWTGSTSNANYTSTVNTSTTVQPEAIQYPYFIQIATGAETENNIINEIELNNPYSLFDSKYSDHELNNLSWLRSEGQYNSKAVYPSAYDELLREYNNPDRLATFNKDAFTVVGNPTITDDGIASGLNNKNNMQLNNSIQIGASSNFKIEFQFTVGNTWVENWIFAAATTNNFCVWIGTGGLHAYMNGKNIVNLPSPTFTQNGSYKGYFKREGGIYTLYCENLKTHTSKIETGTATEDYSFSGALWMGKSGNSRDWSTDLKQFSITVDGVKVFSGAKSKVKLSTEEYTDYDFVLNTAEETFRLPLKNHTADDGNSVLTLYFYVGETVQNANLIDAGRIGEQLATKTDMLQASGAGMPSNKYINLTLGASGTKYTAPANGWVSFCVEGNANGLFGLNNRTITDFARFSTFIPAPAKGVTYRTFMPIMKNSEFSIEFYNSITPQWLVFIYAQGSESEAQ